MALFAVFQPDPRALARINAALADHHELVVYHDWASLAEALDVLPADGCLIDPYDLRRPLEIREIQRLRERHRSLAIVVYADFRGHEMDLFTLGRLQIDGVVPADGHDGVRQIREAVSEALATSVASRVAASLGPRLSRLALECLRWAIENSHRDPVVEMMAESFGRSPRALTRLLHADGAPRPGRLLIWGRLIRAAQLLGDRNATVDQVAFAVGYSSGAALARALRRETGYPPGEVLKRGGIGCVLDGFARKELRPALPKAAGRWRIPPAFPRSRRSGGRG